MNTRNETPGASAGELTEEVQGEVLNLSDPAQPKRSIRECETKEDQ